nr:MAG TPA_asm: zinc finger protein [Caudoviricetes sp.]
MSAIRAICATIKPDAPLISGAGCARRADHFFFSGVLREDVSCWRCGA